MKNAILFDSELAGIYDETRPLDPEACRACFRKVLETMINNKNAMVADIGCGTGRILECLIPDLFKAEQTIGVDISKAMISVARSKARLVGVEFYNRSVIDFAKAPDNQNHFDMVVCHWLFHCLPNWQEALRACVSIVKENGSIVWFDEDGDLYRVLDGKDLDQSNPDAKLLKQLFNFYYKAVNSELQVRGLNPINPISRVGTRVRCTEELIMELSGNGGYVQEKFDAYHWSKRVTIDWIIQFVFVHRAFTNLREIPVIVNRRAISKLLQLIGRGILPAGKTPLLLRFSIKPIVARFGANTKQLKSIQTTSNDHTEDVL